MPEIFQEYKGALIDASFFQSKFTVAVQYGLRETAVYVAGTFENDVTQYKAILPPDKNAVYDFNLAFLHRNIELKELTQNEPNAQYNELHNDTWGILTCLAKTGKKFVLLTADRLLIQRVVLCGINIDIYDLRSNAFMYQHDFPSYSSDFHLSRENGIIADIGSSGSITEKTVLYRTDGSTVVLGSLIKSGLEANIFQVSGNTDLIAKIFKKGRLDNNKYKNIEAIRGMNRLLGVEWALFPIDFVYSDPHCTVLAGITEKYGRSLGNLDKNPLYLGNLSIPDINLNTHISESLELCLKIVRQVRYLNNFGFMISDFNMGNFAETEDDPDRIQMWDTDSFGYDHYFSGYCSGNETSREYDTTKKTDAIGFCNESLYVFVFSVLTLGDAPISEYDQSFKFDKLDYPGGFRRNFVPENLWTLFESVFRGEKEPSVEILQQQLQVALQKYDTRPDWNKTYLELIKGKCPPDPPQWSIADISKIMVIIAAIGLLLYVLITRLM